MNDLTFKQLRNANLERDRLIWNEIDTWTLSDWATAMAGEVGEACNFIKKHKRTNNHSYSIVKELADTVIYADILCHVLGYDLGEVIRDKFNEVSDRVKSDIKL